MLSTNEIRWMTALVEELLDKSLPLYHVTKAPDGSGHTTETYPDTPSLILACTVTKPTATVLQVYADIIAGNRALMLHYMPDADVREGDLVVYQGVNWKVQPVEGATSYTFTNEVLITALV